MSLWTGRLLLLTGVAMGVFLGGPVFKAAMIGAIALTVFGIENAYRHALRLLERDRDRWQAKYREEHESFQRWLRKLARDRHERKS